MPAWLAIALAVAALATVFGLLTGWIAGTNSRDRLNWFALGFLFGVIALLVVAFLGDKPPALTGHGAENLVEVRGLQTWFPVQQGLIATLLSRGHTDYVKAVDGVDFTIKRGEVLGLAGESGSGKSTVGRLVLGLLDPSEGDVVIDGVNLAEISNEELREYRYKMQVVFQDPLASLNPRMTVGQAIEHPAQIHMEDVSPEERKRLVFELLEAVGMSPPDFFYNKYPHQVSGGQRQRIVLARALITRPELIVADEPIASADVSVQALLLQLMIKLKREFDLTYLFITHDLATTKYICDRIGIMCSRSASPPHRTASQGRDPQPDQPSQRVQLPSQVLHRCHGRVRRRQPPAAACAGVRGPSRLVPPAHRRLPAPRPAPQRIRRGVGVRPPAVSWPGDPSL